MNILKENFKFCLSAAGRAAIVAGIVYFSSCLVTKTLDGHGIDQAIVGAGVYFFIELARRFKVSHPLVPKGKKANIKFLLLP